LRIPDDLKDRLRDFSHQHEISLNLEIVMRLFQDYEKHRQHSVAANINRGGYRAVAEKQFTISDSEQRLLCLFRGLNEANKKVIMTLINNLTDND